MLVSPSGGRIVTQYEGSCAVPDLTTFILILIESLKSPFPEPSPELNIVPLGVNIKLEGVPFGREMLKAVPSDTALIFSGLFD